LPFKLNQDRHNHIPRQRRKVISWNVEMAIFGGPDPMDEECSMWIYVKSQP
jgi:hypothetical protein